jgi:hypothetical protein
MSLGRPRAVPISNSGFRVGAASRVGAFCRSQTARGRRVKASARMRLVGALLFALASRWRRQPADADAARQYWPWATLLKTT